MFSDVLRHEEKMIKTKIYSDCSERYFSYR